MMAAFDGSLRPIRNAVTAPAAVFGIVGFTLVAAAIIVAYLSIAGFAIVIALIVVTVAIAALRWPRAMLVLVVIAPILDRFVIAELMPAAVHGVTQFFSEGLLLVVGAPILVQGWRFGRVIPALRHPATIGMAAFLGVAAISAVVNAVPLSVGIVGLAYTVDAIVLFYLARVVGFTHRQAIQSIGAIVVAMLLLAVIGIGQGLLDPNLFGLAVVSGRSGEAVRIGSLVRNPNVLGTLIGLVLPLALFGAVRLSRPRARWAMAGVALLLSVALLLTYSRGSWLGTVAGSGVVLLLLDRRVFAFAALTGVVALGIATFMPRNLVASPSGAGGAPLPPQFNIIDTTSDRIGAVGEGRDLRTMFVLNAVPILRDHPLVGVGPGRYGGAAAYDTRTPVYDRYDTWKLLTAQRTVDNFWLHILVENGILGALAFAGAMVAVAAGLVKTALRSRASRYVVAAGLLAGAASVVVSNGTTMLLEGNTVAFMFWLLLGIGSLYQPTPNTPDRA
jgi:O-antigen ligase